MIAPISWNLQLVWFLATTSFILLICNADTLEAQFLDPPHEFSMVPFWAWNGTLRPDQLRWQMDQMKEKGIYGAFMHARAGLDASETPYFSDGWWAAVDTCIQHGKEIGFSPWIYDEDKWPSGSAGGRVLKKNPERNRQKALHFTESRVAGPCKNPLPNATYCIAGRLLDGNRIDPDSLTVLAPTPNATESSWSCPAGEWMVVEYRFEPFLDGINYLNKDTVRDFMDITHEEYARRYGSHFGSTIPGVFFDEIMNDAGKKPGFHVWVEDFAEQFKKIKGYDLVPFLPGLAHNIGPKTPKIRCDYYEVYATLYEEAWFKQLAEWCAQHQLKLTGHTLEEPSRYVTQGDYSRTIRNLQIPMTDNEDFRYTWPRKIGAWKPKQIASVAHLYDKPMAGVEALGGAGWSFTLESARYGFNMLSVFGVDYFVPHLFHYAEDTPANMDDWPNSWFFQNPYWKYFKTLADHTRRISFMQAGGRPVIDVAVLYPQCNLWTGHGSGTTEQTVEKLIASQIDVDVMDPASLLRATIQHNTGKEPPSLVCGRANYKVIILPGVRCLRNEEAAKLMQFIRTGGHIIIHDWWPTDSMENGEKDPYLARFRQEAEACGIHPVPLNDTVKRIESTLGRDLSLKENDLSILRYRHVVKENKDIYWIVNGSRDKGSWSIRFRALGTPSLWNPEDGSIHPVTFFSRENGHTECSVSLDAGQGCFVVFENTVVPPEGGIRITSTSLADPSMETSDNRCFVSGYQRAENQQATLEGNLITGSSKIPFSQEKAVLSTPESLLLTDHWRFLVVGNYLDYQWQSDLKTSEITLPIMKIQWEHPGRPIPEDWKKSAFNDRSWRQIKVLDTLLPEKGADRYRSNWDGRFITLNPYRTFDIEKFFSPQLGGKGLRCRNVFVLSPEYTRGCLTVICPGPFQILVNDSQCGSGKGGDMPETIEITGLRPGENTLTLIADNAPALLIEGQFLGQYASPISFFSDETWSVSLNGKDWVPAWEYVAPPEPPYGEPRHPQYTNMPDVLCYRQPLPPGTVAIYEPRIEGKWEAWANGKKLVFRQGKASVSKTNCKGMLALRVSLGTGEHGLMEPVRIQCAGVEAPLSSWAQQGLDWYSGRGCYSRSFTLGKEYFNRDTKLELDLGKVDFCAEIWLNGHLVCTKTWPPYRTDITQFVHPGKNTLDVIVANLSANRMRWDIFDEAKSNMNNRKWHDDTILRDNWCLESGLFGPVRILSSHKVQFEIPVP